MAGRGQIDPSMEMGRQPAQQGVRGVHGVHGVPLHRLCESHGHRERCCTDDHGLLHGKDLRRTPEPGALIDLLHLGPHPSSRDARVLVLTSLRLYHGCPLDRGPDSWKALLARCTVPRTGGLHRATQTDHSTTVDGLGSLRDILFHHSRVLRGVVHSKQEWIREHWSDHGRHRPVRGRARDGRMDGCTGESGTHGGIGHRVRVQPYTHDRILHPGPGHRIRLCPARDPAVVRSFFEALVELTSRNDRCKCLAHLHENESFTRHRELPWRTRIERAGTIPRCWDGSTNG